MDKEPNNKNRLSLQSVRESLRTLSLSTLLLIVTTAVALVAVGSLAWMSENRKLDADGVHANMDDEVFNVLSQNSISADTYLLGGDYHLNDAGLGNSYSVLCALQIDPDSTSTSSDPGSFRPRATGKMTFKIVPTQDDQKFVGKLSLAAIGKKEEDSGYEFFSADTVAPGSQREMALNLLQGHVLFFATRNEKREGDDYYTYGDRIKPGDPFYITGSVTAGEEYTINLYWEWPRTYDRLFSILCYDGDDAEANKDSKTDQELDKENDIRTLISETDRTIYLTDEANDDAAYNDADTVIALCISHIMSQIVLEETQTTSTPTVTIGD